MLWSNLVLIMISLRRILLLWTEKANKQRKMPHFSLYRNLCEIINLSMHLSCFVASSVWWSNCSDLCRGYVETLVYVLGHSFHWMRSSLATAAINDSIMNFTHGHSFSRFIRSGIILIQLGNAQRYLVWFLVSGWVILFLVIIAGLRSKLRFIK